MNKIKEIHNGIIIFGKIRNDRWDLGWKGLNDEDQTKGHCWDNYLTNEFGIRLGSLGIIGSIKENNINLYLSGCEFATISRGGSIIHFF